MWQYVKNKLFSLQALLVVCIIIGVVLRVYQFGQIPVGTYWDETAMLVDATAIASTGHDMHGNNWFQAIFPSYGDFKLPVYIWLSALVVKVIGSSEIAVRLPSLLAGFATIGLGAMLAGQLAKYWSSNQRRIFIWTTASVIALSFWAIMFSRTGFEGYLAQLWMGLALLSLLKSKNSPIHWLFAGLLGSLALFTYYSTRFIWPMLWLVMAIPIIKDMVFNPDKRQHLLSKQLFPLVGSLLIFLFSLIMMMRSPLYPASELFRLSSDSLLNPAPFVTESNVTKAIEGPTVVGNLILHRYVFQAKTFIEHISAHFSLNYLFFSGDHNLRHGTGMHGLFPFVFAPILLLGALGLFKHHRWLLLFLLYWWIVALLPASVPYDVPHALRSLNSLLPISLIIGYGLTTLVLAPITQRVLIYRFFFLILFLEMFAFAHFLFMVYPVTSASEWQAGYKQLAQYVVKNQSDVNQFWINSGDGRLYLWLLAYGNLSATEIQKFPWQGYQLSQIGTVNFSDFVYTQEGIPNTPFALAGRRKEITENLAIVKVKPQEIITIFDTNGQEQFIVTYFNLSMDQLNHVKQ